MRRPMLRFEGLEGERTQAQLSHFMATLKSQTNDPLLRSARFSSWEDAFTFLTDRAILGKKKTILFFDEIQWMAAGRTKLLSLIKYFWDLHWKNANVMVILCGSISTYMTQKVVRSRALYGRITAEIGLRGLAPREAAMMFRGRRSLAEVLQYLLIFGGIPHYLEQIQLSRSFNQNVNRLCFTSYGSMTDEFEKIFYSQFREHRTYLRIAALLKERPLSLQQISQKLKMASGGGLKRYLSNLEQADILHVLRPFRKSPTTKEAKYILIDEYLNFYFKFIRPHSQLIKQNDKNRNLFDRISKESLQPWLGFAFERFSLRHALWLADLMGFGEHVLEAAPYFRRDDRRFQIDLLYQRTDKVITLCEIKYRNKQISTAVVPEVDRKCHLLDLPRGYTLERALISVHGPSAALRETEYFHHFVSLRNFFPDPMA